LYNSGGVDFEAVGGIKIYLRVEVAISSLAEGMINLLIPWY